MYHPSRLGILRAESRGLESWGDWLHAVHNLQRWSSRHVMRRENPLNQTLASFRQTATSLLESGLDRS